MSLDAGRLTEAQQEPPKYRLSGPRPESRRKRIPGLVPFRADRRDGCLPTRPGGAAGPDGKASLHRMLTAASKQCPGATERGGAKVFRRGGDQEWR